jgi:hypothetical protein
MAENIIGIAPGYLLTHIVLSDSSPVPERQKRSANHAVGAPLAMQKSFSFVVRLS